MIKRISAMILALTLAIGCFASCGDKDESSSKASDSSSASTSDSDSSVEDAPDPSLTIDGKKVDTKDL
ncbi:MAG: hypothetical protein ACI4I7_02520, partial [Oscillospiraceae bacterium]